MTTKGNKPPLVLDMPFGEALARFAKVDTTELPTKDKKKRVAKQAGRHNPKEDQ